MKLNWKIISTVVGTQIAFTSLAADDADIDALKQQIQALDQKVRILERERENDQDAALTTAKATPKISLGANGFSFSSADSNFVAQLHAVVQVDNRSFFKDNGIRGNDGFLLRRARPIFSGTVWHDFDFNFTPDFGGNTVQIFDAYINYRYNTELQLEVGKYKSPVGLESLQADQYISFNERSLATGLVPNRDVGAALHGDLFNGALNYWAGIFDGSSDYNGTTTNSPLQDNKAFEGRLFAQPWKNSSINWLQGLGFGVGGSYLSELALNSVGSGLTPGYTSDGQQKWFAYTTGTYASGDQWRVSPQGYYYYGPLGILGEYVVSDQNVQKANAKADLQNTAWEITGSWVLTGEDASYTGVTPLHPFDPRKNQWGAFQLVARIEELDVDSAAFNGGTFASTAASAKSAQAWSVGLNWYLNRNVRVNGSFSHTKFDGYTGPIGVAPAQDENVLFTRLQLAF
jgi:phosphate-selective porin OprO/OprP